MCPGEGATYLPALVLFQYHSPFDIRTVANVRFTSVLLPGQLDARSSARVGLTVGVGNREVFARRLRWLDLNEPRRLCWLDLCRCLSLVVCAGLTLMSLVVCFGLTVAGVLASSPVLA